MTTLNKAEAIVRIKNIEALHKDDPEAVHNEAIAVLLEFLGAQGHEDLVEAYQSANARFWHQ